MSFLRRLVLLAGPYLVCTGCHSQEPSEHKWEVWREACKTYAQEKQVVEKIPGRSIYTSTEYAEEIAWPGGNVLKRYVSPRTTRIADLVGHHWTGPETDATCNHADNPASTCRFEEVETSAELVETTPSGPVKTGIELLSRAFYDHARGLTLGSGSYLTMSTGESRINNALSTLFWSKGHSINYVRCGSGIGPQDVFDVTAWR